MHLKLEVVVVAVVLIQASLMFLVFVKRMSEKNVKTWMHSTRLLQLLQPSRLLVLLTVVSVAVVDLEVAEHLCIVVKHHKAVTCLA